MPKQHLATFTNSFNTVLLFGTFYVFQSPSCIYFILQWFIHFLISLTSVQNILSSDPFSEYTLKCKNMTFDISSFIKVGKTYMGLWPPPVPSATKWKFCTLVEMRKTIEKWMIHTKRDKRLRQLKGSFRKKSTLGIILFGKLLLNGWYFLASLIAFGEKCCKLSTSSIKLQIQTWYNTTKIQCKCGNATYKFF